MKHGQPNYSSKDFYLSSCLVASGFTLTHISQSPRGFLLFNLNCSENEALAVLNKHWSGQLKLPTKNFIEAIYQLKNRMRAESR